MIRSAWVGTWSTQVVNELDDTVGFIVQGFGFLVEGSILEVSMPRYMLRSPCSATLPAIASTVALEITAFLILCCSYSNDTTAALSHVRSASCRINLSPWCRRQGVSSCLSWL